MQPKVTLKAYNRTRPQWSGTPGHQPKALVPGGAHLNAAAFQASNNPITITVATGGASAGAATIPVNALTDGNGGVPANSVLVPAGTLLTFTGGVTATLTANALKGETSIAVSGLSGNVAATNTATYTPPQYTPINAIRVVVGVAGAAQNATSIPIAAATDNNASVPSGTVLIPAGALLDFSGSGKFARVGAAVTKGATTIAVEALPVALVSGDAAVYSPYKGVYVASGTLIGRTRTERDAGVGFGPADVATDHEIHLLYFDVNDVMDDNECELYMSNAGNVVYENFLPGFSALPDAQKNWIRANYTAIVAQP